MRAGFYIHENFTDCFIEVLKVQYQDAKRLKGRVMWYNLGFTGKPWLLRSNDPIEIKAEDLKKWQRFDPDKDWKELREKQQQNQLVRPKS